MKTFEERYTAWIDGKLEGPALTSFELELSRRASAGEARADKDDAAKLHRLLTSYLQAPAMGNAEFFSHQLRERIDAERRASGGRREEARTGAWNLAFLWPFARMAGLGAACAFVAAAIYYGTVPSSHNQAGQTSQVAVNNDHGLPGQNPPANVASQPTEPATTPQIAHDPSQRAELALASPTPPPVDLDVNIQVMPVPGSSTNATPLHYKDPNVSVLWVNGLDYMPNVPGETPAGASGNAAPAPTGSATP